MKIINPTPIPAPTALPPALPLKSGPGNHGPEDNVFQFEDEAQNVHVLFQNATGYGNPVVGVAIEVYTYLTNTSPPAMVASFTFDADNRVDVPLPTNTLGAKWMYVRQVPPTAPGANDPVLFQIAHESENTVYR